MAGRLAWHFASSCSTSAVSTVLVSIFDTHRAPGECQSTWTDCVCCLKPREIFPCKLGAAGRACVFKNQRGGFQVTTILSNLSETTYWKYFKYWKKWNFYPYPQISQHFYSVISAWSTVQQDSWTRNYQGFSALLSLWVQKSSRLLKVWNPILVAQETKKWKHSLNNGSDETWLQRSFDWKDQTQQLSPPKATGRKMRWMLAPPHLIRKWRGYNTQFN